jgi:hypothetical protein
VTDALRTLAFGGAIVTITFGWLAIRTAQVPAGTPDRLVAEFRVVRLAALLLALTAGAYVGFAAAAEARPGVGLDVVAALGFLVVAAVALTRDPHDALALLAVAFLAHAVVGIAHRPGLLPAGIAPRWYAVGGAAFDVCLGALCYVPLLRRS